MSQRSGIIEYTERAFQQDAEQAMGGNIILALVELITNCDDAYGDRVGTIDIEVDRHSETGPSVRVRDTAGGLSSDDLERCFGVLGGRTSGFDQGERVRGLFGRGAKDTATFGATTFETIHDGILGRFELTRTGHWTNDEPRLATSDDRRRLGYESEDNGLVATIHLSKYTHTLPNRTRMLDQLRAHVQLREISSRRVIRFADDANGRRRTDIVVWEQPAGTVVADTTIEIPRYSATAALKLWKLDSPSDGRVNSYSRNGIVVRGMHANFCNTMFGQSGLEIASIAGELCCPRIDELVRDYDKTQGTDPDNPIRLLRRDRDGLVAEHPFYADLERAVLEVLLPVLEELRPARPNELGSGGLKRNLKQAGAALAALLRSDLQRIDADEPGGGTALSSSSPLFMIPPRLGLRVGTSRSISLLIRSDECDAATVRVMASSSSVVDVGTPSQPTPHSYLDGHLVVQVRLAAIGLGDARVVAECGAFTATCEVQVHDDSVEPERQPDEFSWRNPTMSVAAGKERSLRLWAPADFAPGGAALCSIELDGPVDACTLLDSAVELRLTSNGWYEGRVKVRGGDAGKSVRVTACSGSRIATGSIRITAPSALDGLGADIRILDLHFGSERGRVIEDDAGLVIELAGQHPGLAGVLGAAAENGTFVEEQTPRARSVLAECVASVVADWLIRKEAERYPYDFPDAAAVIAKRNPLVARYLPPLQRALADG